jgi:hypothetical protein
LNKNYPKYEMLKGNLDEGFLDAFSIAYVPEKVRTKGDDRYLGKVNLLNVAFTGNPVNPKASFTSVLMKSLQDEVCKQKGGFSMKTNEKEEQVSDSKLEVKALVEKYDALEKQVSELKSLIEKKEEPAKPEEPSKPAEPGEEKPKEAEKEEAEAEAKSKEAEAKSLELEAKLKSIEEKQAEIDKVLSAPIFKARAEIMQKALNEAETEKQEKEVKSRGTLDLLR